MSTVLSTLAVIVVLAIAALLLYAASRPDTTHIERSVRIAASAEAIQPLINDMASFNTWNPFTRKDPAMTGSYRGPASGPGAAYDFKGGKSGSGSIEILAPSAPNRVTMALDMSAPLACHNIIDFTLAPQGHNSTEVSWAMHGRNPFLGKLMGVLVNIDKMVGRDFESGLASLKALAEPPA